MKKSQIITSLIVLAVLGLAAFVMNKGRSGRMANDKAPEVGKAVFENFPLNEATSVQIKTAKEEVNLVKTGDVWGVKERDGFPANYANVKELLTKIWDAKVVEANEVGASQLGRLQLKAPGTEGAKEEEVGTLISVKNGEKEVASFTIGKDIEGKSEGDSPFGSFNQALGKFLKVAGKDGWAYRVKETFSSANADTKGWLEKTFIAPSGAFQSFEVKPEAADQAWKVTREKDTAEPVLAGATEADEIDPEKLKQLTLSPTFNDVAIAADKDKTGIDKPKREATIVYFDGFTYQVKVGNFVKPEDPNGDHYISFTVAYTQPPQPAEPPALETAEPAPPAAPEPIKPAENETPEQKTEREKKDAEAMKKWEEFKATAKKTWEDSKAAAQKKWEEDKVAAKKKWEDDHKTKEERLKKEKALEGKTYIVSKYGIEKILSDRSSFKKAPPAPPAGAGAPTPSIPSLSAPGAPRIEAVSPAVEIPPAPRHEAVTPPVAVPPLPDAPKPTDPPPGINAPKIELTPPATPAEAAKPTEPAKPADAPKPQ